MISPPATWMGRQRISRSKITRVGVLVAAPMELTCVCKQHICDGNQGDHLGHGGLTRDHDRLLINTGANLSGDVLFGRRADEYHRSSRVAEPIR
jgi:hypothetical protein